MASQQDLGRTSPAIPGWQERIEALAAVAELERWPTPMLAVDLDTLEGNLAQMSGFFEGRKARVRSHTKAHKCTEIARMQIKAHGGGVTCSTTDEVTAMIAAGIDDVLLANVVTDRLRLETLVRAAQRATITVAADSLEAVALLSAAAQAADAEIGIVVEREIGLGRNGVVSLEDGLRVADAVLQAPSLGLRGVMAYEGHLVEIHDRLDRGKQAVEAMAPALDLLGELRARGLDVPIFTGGSTATYADVGVLPEMTDVQAGTYVLMDAAYRWLNPEFEPALALIATVLTSRRDGSLVLDVGAKRSGSEEGPPELVGVQATHRYTAEEHTVFDVSGGTGPAVGQRVALLPGHACTTMSLYRAVHACRSGAFERTLAIDARDPNG